jgi:hypothetical protein
MLNNILNIWVIIVLFIFTINILIRIYKYYKFNYTLSLSIERLVLLNGKDILYFTFKDVKSLHNFSTEKYFKVMINTVLQYLNDLYSTESDAKLYICFYDYDHNTKLHSIISDPCIIHFNSNISVNQLYSILNLHSFVGPNVVVVIKCL